MEIIKNVSIVQKGLILTNQILKYVKFVKEILKE